MRIGTDVAPITPNTDTRAAETPPADVFAALLAAAGLTTAATAATTPDATPTATTPTGLAGSAAAMLPLLPGGAATTPATTNGEVAAAPSPASTSVEVGPAPGSTVTVTSVTVETLASSPAHAPETAPAPPAPAAASAPLDPSSTAPDTPTVTPAPAPAGEPDGAPTAPPTTTPGSAGAALVDTDPAGPAVHKGLAPAGADGPAPAAGAAGEPVLATTRGVVPTGVSATPGASATEQPIAPSRFAGVAVAAARASADADRPVRLSVRLDPPNLGEVRVELTARNGVVTVRVEAISDSAAPLLNQQRNAVAAALERTGFSLASFDVAAGEHQQRQTEQNKQKQSHRTDRIAGLTALDETGPEPLSTGPAALRI